MFQDASGVNQKFGPDPRPDPVPPADPGRWWTQATAERHRVAKQPFDPSPQPVQGPPERGVQQGNAAPPVRALVVVPLAGFLPLAVRCKQLVTPAPGQVVQ